MPHHGNALLMCRRIQARHANSGSATAHLLHESVGGPDCGAPNPRLPKLFVFNLPGRLTDPSFYYGEHATYQPRIQNPRQKDLSPFSFFLLVLKLFNLPSFLFTIFYFLLSVTLFPPHLFSFLCIIIICL